MAGLWIRSQDRKVLKQYNEFSIGTFADEAVIFGTFEEMPVNHRMPIVLGTYKSEERALQVLDEIQSLIRESYFNIMKAQANLMDWDAFSRAEDNIYQMPKE